MIKKYTLSTQKPLIKSQKAAIYIRVSTEEQAKEGYSLSAQEDALKNYALSLGYSVFRVYKDEGRSAKDMKHRPELQQLLRDAEDKKFDAVFVYKLDRFSRSLKDLILTIEKLKEWGVDFISLQDKIETASASGKLMFHIISSFAEFERDIISERTRFGMAEKAKEGGIVTKPAKGYKIDNGRLVIDPEKAEEVRKIFNDFINTSKSLNQIAKENGLSTRGLIKLLKNRTYLGEIKFKKRYQGSHEAIISKETFEKAAEKLKKDSYKRLFMKNLALLKDILYQEDPDSYDSIDEKVLAYFISNDAIIIDRLDIGKMEKPPIEALNNMGDSNKEARFLAAYLLKEEGFHESDMVFRNEGGPEMPDISIEKDSKKIYVLCGKCDARNVLQHVSSGAELWITVGEIYPWSDDFSNIKKIKSRSGIIILKKGPKWEEVYKNHIEKIKAEADSIISPHHASNDAGIKRLSEFGFENIGRSKNQISL